MNARLIALTIASTLTACATADQLEALAVTAELVCAGGRAADAADQQAGAIIAAGTCWWADYMAGRADRRRDIELDAAAAKLRSALEADARAQLAEADRGEELEDVAAALDKCVEIQARNEAR